MDTTGRDDVTHGTLINIPNCLGSNISMSGVDTSGVELIGGSIFRLLRNVRI